MKISEFSLNNLAKAVCGDLQYTPYLKGFELVIFFNRYGFNDTYESGFPSRWKYTEDCLRKLNGTDTIRQIIEEIVDPRKYHGLEQSVENAVEKINEFLKYDKYEIRKYGDYYKVTDMQGIIVQPEATIEINHQFINEQIVKCNKKIGETDFNGAITNARTLIETIFIEIIERHNGHEIKNDGNVDNQWKQVKK